ncbi:Structure-specific endonuclease subunit SLX4 [Apiospora marii]|uniref:Structure-specific endonuclease subunit SLX4 n=1 Tax=Apiospora marii TaxID=335849 RepID=A0ABR1RI44_9PEZI
MYSTTTKPPKGPPAEPRPSSSIILLSHTNQVLLLRRVKTSRSFASAHVFPGGNLSEFHDGPLASSSDGLAQHVDSLAYRLGAVRETFEESGILLARRKGAPVGDGGGLLVLSAQERDEARKAIYNNEVRFTEWLDNNLLPFTRWVTPPATPRRFTTQMYIYMLPFPQHTSASLGADDSISNAAIHAESVLPTPDGAEITTSAFEDAATWLSRQQSGDIILFPPQAFLLTLISQFCPGPPPPESSSSAPLTRDNSDYRYYQRQRDELTEFLHRVPTASKPRSLKNPTSRIPWADKVISPVTTMVTDDGRILLSLDRPGPELRGSGRGGDFERVVLVRFEKGTARQVQVLDREEAFRVLRPAEAAQGAGAGKEKL